VLDVRIIREQFRERFGGECRVFRAPGRVNLIGEHTDYNDGFVLPASIDLYTWIAISPDSGPLLNIHSRSVAEDATVDVDNPGLAGSRHWSDYIRGVVVELKRRGIELQGGNVLIDSDVPMGAGLSSSAAVEVAAGLALLSSSGQRMEPLDLARLCQRAESDFVGARCGIMDQFIALFGRVNHAVMLDCRSLEHSEVPLPPDVRLVICNTMVKHELASGEYNLRRQECEEGVRILSKKRADITALRDVKIDELEQSQHELPEVVFRRCRHVVTEDDRVIEAVGALTGGELGRLGGLMAASHQSLRDDFEVSCVELDAIVELAVKCDGVYGARMTGGGFGGCTINLVGKDSVDRFKETVSRGYESVWGKSPDIFVCAAASGASEA
jgi:galactokinase